VFKARHRAEKALKADKKAEKKATAAEKKAAAEALKKKRGDAKMARRREARLPDMQAGVARLLSRPEGLPLDQYADPETDRLTSQHGEDGLTVELVRRVGIEHRRAVEIGCGSNGGNAGVLVAGLGFEALLLDGDEELIAIARDYFAGQPARVESAWITRETVNDLLAGRGFDRDLDYLGIDLDGIDLWVWEALKVSPRMVICEYNAYLGPDEAVTIPYTPDFVRKARDKSGKFAHPKGYYGASLSAFERLGRRKGYRLVATAPGSENAYFLREDVDGGVPAVSAVQAWRPRTKGKAATPYRSKFVSQIEKEGVRQYFEKRGAPLVEVE
jgi:hypothetical protein